MTNCSSALVSVVTSNGCKLCDDGKSFLLQVNFINNVNYDNCLCVFRPFLFSAWGRLKSP